MVSQDSLTTFSVTHFVWRGLLSHKIEAIAIFLVSFCVFIGNIAYPFSLKLMVDTLIDFQLGLYFDWTRIGWLVVMAAAWWSMFNIPGVSAEMLMARFGANLRNTIRLGTTNYILGHSVSFFHDSFAGSIGSQINDLSVSIYEIVYDSLLQILPGLAYLCCLTFVFIHLHIGYALIFAAWMFVQMGTLIGTHKKSKEKSQNNAKEYSKLIGKIIDGLTNHIAIRSFNAKEHEKILLEEQGQALLLSRIAHIYYTRGVWWIVGWIQPLFVFGGFLGLYLYLFTKGQATPGDLVFLMPSIGGMMSHVRHLTTRILAVYEHTGIAQNAINALLVPYQVTDKEAAIDLKIAQGTVDLQNIGFAYNETAPPVLSDISFTIQAGEKVGLVGYSGAGKSTLVNLLLRFYNASQGKILIDGQDIADITQNSLRQAISFIPQDISLFHRSLAENIRIAKPDATMQEIIHAAQLAGADDFISVLPNGYDTLVGERGVKLSGGQRQRVAIARAFLHGAPILILDEATSALDSVTESAIQSALDRVMTQRTSLVIAHRLSTLRRMDRIIVMDRGRIIEQGTHDQLLAMPSGHYARMWAMQAGGFLPLT